MSLRGLRITTGRVLRQLAHDRRTIALILVMPPLLLTLIYFMWEDQPFFNHVALIMLGVFPFIIMFLLTSITVLRERMSGTLERLFTTPLRKLDLLFGYGIAFGLAAAVETSVGVAFAHWVLGMEANGSLWLVILIAFANALLGVALGLLCSAYARTEFQAVQFLPLIVIPQIFLCGLFVPRDQMAGWLEVISNFMPMSYSVQALTEVGANVDPTSTMWSSLGIVFAVVVAALALGALTLRRRTV